MPNSLLPTPYFPLTTPKFHYAEVFSIAVVHCQILFIQ